MKKSMLLFFILLLTGAVYAQFYSGIKPQVAFPLKPDEIDTGTGSDLLLGYSVSPKVDLEIGVGKIWFNSLWESYQLQSVKANARYFITGTSAKPFMGIGAGYFNNKYSAPLNSEFEDNAFGVMPSAGVLFDLNGVKGLSLLTELSYCHINLNRQASLLSVGVGLKYSFRDS